MAEILEPKAGESIYDPTCGTGGMLISCIARCKAHEENWREIKAYGQEQNALTSSVARMNLFLHGVEEFRIVNDDTLLRPGFLNAGQLKTFNVVLANPPYSIKQWNRELFSNDPYGRNFLGTPPQGRADYAFIQHILKSMDPQTGRAAILLPHGVLFREEEKHIRKALIENDLIEAVIGLAPNLFYNSPMEACVMVCRTNKSEKAKGRILFINAVGEVTRKNAESKLETWHMEKILKAYSERTSDGVFAYDATIEEIAAKDWSLAISLYAHVGGGSSQVAEISVVESLSDFATSFTATQNALSALALDFGFDAPPDSDVLTAGDSILRRGVEAQRVKFDNIAFNSNEKKKPTPDDAPYYIGLEHIDPGSFTITRWGSDVPPICDKLVMRKGDVLFGRRRAYQKKVAIAPFDGIFSAHGMVLRPKTDVVDAKYFPFFIASDQFMDTAVRISVGGLSPTINWKTLKECEFDLPPLARQRELADLLWAANDLKESYKKMIVATDEMLKAKFREMFGDTTHVKLAEIALMWLKGQPFKKEEMVSEGKTLCIHYGELFTKYGYIIRDVASTTNADIIKKSKFGDILFPASDVTPNGLTKCSALMVDGVLLGGDIIVLRPKEDFVPEYLSFAICSESDQVLKCVTGGLIKHISAKSIKEVTIPLPPISLQREFVAIAEKADVAKAAIKKSIADIDQVMKGLVNG